jgi:hypothetical protein
MEAYRIDTLDRTETARRSCQWAAQASDRRRGGEVEVLGVWRGAINHGFAFAGLAEVL